MRRWRTLLDRVVFPFRWLGDWMHYRLFKWKQARAMRQSEKDDPNVYPLW